MKWKSAAIILVLTFSMMFSFAVTPAAAASSEYSMLVYVDNFDDYVVKSYSGNDGPGQWIQSVGGGGSAVYKITSESGRIFYKLDSTTGNGMFVKSYLPYFFFIMYIGPSNYTFKALMKVNKDEGGVLFRAQPVEVGGNYILGKYYLAIVYRNVKKAALWYVDESKSPVITERLAYVDIPSSVDLSNWIWLSVTAKGDNIKVNVAGKDLINVNDDRLTYGTVGLFTYKGCAASFDLINWIAHIQKATTVTQTVTTTILSGTTVTSTVGGGTTTVTATEITTAPAETVTQTMTKTELSTTTLTTTMTETKTETKTETSVSTVTENTGFGSKCLIATAAFGSELAPQVQALRNFRDGFVLNSFAGENFMTAFNAFYYSWSPYVADVERGNPMLRATVRTLIYPLLFSLDLSRKVAEPFSAVPELAVLVSGFVASALIGLIYIAPIAVAAALVLRWRRKDFDFKLIYPAAALGFGLVMFVFAEVSLSPILMTIASSVIVLAVIALSGLAPIKLIRAWKARS